MDHLKLTTDKLSVEEISELVVDSSCGAVSLFVGTTRDNFEGKKVLRLEYEAYEPMATKAMKAICDDIRRQWPSVHGIAIYHRLGIVPAREASVVIAVSSPHRQAALSAVAACIDQLKQTVTIWKKEVYDEAGQETTAWKENVESGSPRSLSPPAEDIDKSLVQINVSNEELQQRIQHFIDRKRQQVNINNIHDFIPCMNADEESCARVRATLVKRNDSKGHLKIRKVHNEWGPQTVRPSIPKAEPDPDLPAGIAERVRGAEMYLNLSAPVPKDVYRRLQALEDRLAQLQAVSPEYAQFWKTSSGPVEAPRLKQDCIFSASDIARKIEQLENQT